MSVSIKIHVTMVMQVDRMQPEFKVRDRKKKKGKKKAESSQPAW